MCHIGQMNFIDLPVEDDHIYPQEEANSLNGINPLHCICSSCISLERFFVIFWSSRISPSSPTTS